MQRGEVFDDVTRTVSIIRRMSCGFRTVSVPRPSP